MNLLDKRGIIRDQIHGFIEINNLEYDLLQHPLIHRLHGIKQLGLSNLVFPGATHTRFSHSLGVMYTAGRIAERIVAQTRRGVYCGRFFVYCDKGMQEFVEVARLTGLLHDIGHPPLSHQMEESLKTVSRMESIMKNIDTHPRLQILAKFESSSLHEAFTGYFIQRLAEDLEDHGKHDEATYVRAAGAIFNAYPASTLEELGLSTDSLHILRDIISNDIFDADRLDYLVRDTTMSGVIFGAIDIERLLIGIQLVESDGKLRIGVHPRSLQTLEDVFDARYKMYKTIYFHHKTIAINVAITKVIQLLFEHWNEVAPNILLKNLNGPEDLYNPAAIADLILSGKTLYTDSDFDMILYNMSSSNNEVLQRWARSLLHDRVLLPISLVKRPEADFINAIEKVRPLDSNIFETLSQIQRNIINENEKFTDPLREEIYKYIRSIIPNINLNDINIEKDKKTIVRGNFTKLLKIHKSMYLYLISQVGRSTLLFFYVFSDDPNIHKVLYKEREKLREIFKEYLAKKIKRYLRA